MDKTIIGLRVALFVTMASALLLYLWALSLAA